MVSAGDVPENYWVNILYDNNATPAPGYKFDDHLFDSSGNIIVSGTSTGNYHFFHRIDPDGNILATKTWRDSSGYALTVTDIAIDNSDNLYASLGNGRIIKWDSSDNVVYSKRNTHRSFGGFPSSDLAFGDSGIGYGSLVLSGNELTYKFYNGSGYRFSLGFSASTGEINSNSTEAFDNTISFSIGGFGKTSQGNHACGYVNNSQTNNDNWWVVTKSDNSLEQLFVFYNSGGAAICRGIDYIDGNYYIVGMRQTDNSFAGDPVILKLGTYSGSGNQGVIWARRARNINNTSDGSYQGQFRDVAGDSEGNIYAVGHSPNPGTTACGIIIKYNSSGSVVWSRFLEWTNEPLYVTKITIDSNDSMWVNFNVVNEDYAGVAKLPTNGEFIGTYGDLTVSDWSGGFTNSSFNHIQQTGSTPNILGGNNTLPLGSPVTASYSEPTMSPTEDIYVAGVISSITESATSFNEGQQLQVDITTYDSSDGIVLYWKVIPTSGMVNASDFSVFSGSVTVSSNAAQINITMANDSATEGTEEFVIKIYSEAQFTNVLGTTRTITINDTSTAPVQHTHNSGTISVPANAFDITFECTGGSGGMGGPAPGVTPSNANNYARSKGGSARSTWFTVPSLTPPFTVNLWPGTGGADNGSNSSTPGTGSGTGGVSGGSSSVGMSGGSGAAGGGGNMGGGGGGSASLIQIDGTYVCIAGGGGGGGGSINGTIGDDGGNYSGYGGSTPWVGTTSPLENGNGAAGGDGSGTNAAGGGGSGGGASFSAVASGSAGGSNGSSVGQGGGSGVSAYRSDIITMGGGSHNPNIAVFGSSDGWAILYYKTP